MAIDHTKLERERESEREEIAVIVPPMAAEDDKKDRTASPPRQVV
jgi:hypothetical protein